MTSTVGDEVQHFNEILNSFVPNMPYTIIVQTPRSQCEWTIRVLVQNILPSCN